MVDFVRHRLAKRASQLGVAQIDNPSADSNLIIDAHRVEAELQGRSARFLVPAIAQTMWLGSDTVKAAKVGSGPHMRTLGVCVGKIVIDDGFGSQFVFADDARFSVGFHYVEAGPKR